MRSSSILAAAFIGGAVAQSPNWGQCGGIGWSGSTTCNAGWSCQELNPYYYQCLQSTGGATTTTTTFATSTRTTTTTTTRPTTTTTTTRPTTTTTTTTTRTTTTTTTTSPSATSNPTGKFKWFGVDESCAEFGNTNIPGVYGTDFTFASTQTIGELMSQGFNIFRLTFLMERMVPNELTGPLSQAYFQNYSVAVNYITNNGGYAIIDPHNFGRYYGNIITDTAGFQAFWTTLASQYASNSRVIFDTNNEYHDMDQTLVLNLNQAAINGIRSTGATSQYIFAEGNSYTGAWTWNTTNTNLAALTDPSNKLVYEMHQYLDSDGSGTSATCVSSDIGVQRVEGATAWLRQNGKLGMLGEYAGGANSVCEQAITGMLNHMLENSDVWLGAAWWAAGPWWGTYIYSFEPPSGTAYTYYDSILQAYVP